MKRYLRAAVAAATAVAFAFTPALADNTATNDTTGANSTNTAVATSNVNCTVKQGNVLLVRNDIVVVSSTGGNEANKNTGNGTVDTGDASSDVSVSNSGNSNDATVNCPDDANNIAGNSTTGTHSTNTAVATSTKKAKVKQGNFAGVGNGVVSVARTGKNKANNNTGNGKVTAGGATGSVDVTNGPLNENTASVNTP